MEVQFSDKIEFETVALEVARDVVVYSFVVQRSLTPLDLSSCENSRQVKSFFTEEQCRKMMEPRRWILYALHLDLPRNLEKSLRAAVPDVDDYEQCESFYLGAIFVCEDVYTRDLTSSIIEPILSAGNDMEKLRRYMNVIKLLDINKCRDDAMFLFDKLIVVLYPYCADSNLVVEFAITFGFSSWIFYIESPEIVDFFLHHAMQIRCNIWQESGWGVDPINGCIIFQKPRNIRALLEYGTCFHFQHEIYLDMFGAFLEPRMIRRIVQKNIPGRRLFLLLQLFYYVSFQYNSCDGLLCIWRSIPDPYLSNNEFVFLFGNIISPSRLCEMIEYYKFYFVEETDETDGIVPRNLQHLCRVAIRRALIRNYQLPNGIYRLCRPLIIRNYLNLGC